MEPTTESKVAITILEESIGVIILDGKTYEIPAPTTATLIAASALISQLPEFDLSIPDDQLAAEVLSHAEAGKTLAQIAATLMLGKKRIANNGKKRWWHRLPLLKKTDEHEALTQTILDNCTPAHLREITFALIKEAGLDDFFILTTSLHTKNILKPTREVDKTTAPGLS